MLAYQESDIAHLKLLPELASHLGNKTAILSAAIHALRHAPLAMIVGGDALEGHWMVQNVVKCATSTIAAGLNCTSILTHGVRPEEQCRVPGGQNQCLPVSSGDARSMLAMSCWTGNQSHACKRRGELLDHSSTAHARHMDSGSG